MKKYFFSLIIFLSFFSVSFADYKLEPTNCTAKKKDNCGAYLYNIKTGLTFFCTSDKCTEILEALEGEVEVEASKLQRLHGAYGVRGGACALHTCILERLTEVHLG